MNNSTADRYTIKFSNNLPSDSELSASFKIVNTDKVHSDMIAYLSPLNTQLNKRYTALKTEIDNGNVDDALTVDGETMTTPSSLAGKYGELIDNIKGLAKDIDEKAYNEARYQCDEFIEYCKSKMRQYTSPDNVEQITDEDRYEGWRLNMLNAMQISVTLNKYNGFDECDVYSEESFAQRVKNHSGVQYFAFSQMNMDPSDTSQSDKFQYSDFEKVGKDDWKIVKGESNTYEYKKDNGVVLKKVTNDKGEVQYYSVTFDSNSNSSSNTKYYTSSGKLITQSKAKRIYNPTSSGSSSGRSSSSSSSSSLEPGSPEWNTAMHNKTTYGIDSDDATPDEATSDEATPPALTDLESEWVKKKRNILDPSYGQAPQSSSSSSDNSKIGVLNNPDFGKAL